MVFTINKTDCHAISKILLKVALKTQNPDPLKYIVIQNRHDITEISLKVAIKSINQTKLIQYYCLVVVCTKTVFGTFGPASMFILGMHYQLFYCQVNKKNCQCDLSVTAGKSPHLILPLSRS